MDAILLVGGLGTRLQKVVPGVAKPLAPINGRPFLDFLLEKLKNKRVILAVGYRSEQFKEKYHNRGLLFSEEKVPLGTGGALKKALKLAESENVLVLNGDTFFDIDHAALETFHHAKRSDLTIACKKMEALRYGTLKVDKTFKVNGFEEKKPGIGWINGGLYIMKKEFLDEFPEGPFSLEKEAFPHLLQKRVFAFVSDAPFIDIGTKESYLEAHTFL